MNKKQIALIILSAFFIGALGSILIGRFVIPYLATFPGWSSLNKLATNSPIIINRTQETQLNEGVNMIDLIKRSGNITVSIYSNSASTPKFLGNGVIMTSDGLIFTTTNVIGKDAEFQVILNDGTRFDAQVRATDPASEIAALTIPATNLPSAQLDEAGSLLAGQRVIVIGRGNTPLQRTFDTGFVRSAVVNMGSTDQVFSSDTFAQTISTDISSNAEIIGGPVINLEGRVVGLMVGGKIVLSEYVQTALTGYLSSGKILRPSLGVHYFNLPQSLATLKGFSKPGAWIASVEKGSLADKAALQANDLIVAVDGNNFEKISFEQALNKHTGTDLKLAILRAGVEMELIIKLN